MSVNTVEDCEDIVERVWTLFGRSEHIIVEECSQFGKSVKTICKEYFLSLLFSFFPRYPSWDIGPESAEPLDSPFLRRYRQLMNETNYAIRSVRDYVRLEREARRRVQAEERTIELKHGNETFIIEKKQLMQKVLELVPGARPITGKNPHPRAGAKTRKEEVIVHKGRPRDKRNNSRKKQKQRLKTNRKVRNIMRNNNEKVKRW